ncbi:MAG: ABC transporter ATP-binding protein [Candidatus Omnitrophota bacterium]|jgi:ABC-type lipoprotein export system ATPase subunit
MNEYMLRASGLRKTYQNGAAAVEVLRGIDLGVKKEEFLVIQGPSGAGKSTLLHILGGLDEPDGGTVFFEDTDIQSFKENERALFRNRKVGFVFQFYHLLPELSALENVLLPMVLRSWWERPKAESRARSLLERLGLGKRTGHMPNQLSGGEQQRAAIARALINGPRLLLCDEPTGNLDSVNGKNILSLLKQLNKEEKTTMVMVTHDKDITGVADRVVHLRDGVVVR